MSKFFTWLFGLRKKYAPTDQELHNEGYLWAVKELRTNANTEQAIQYVEAMTYGVNSAFDRGAQQALREFTAIDVTDYERNLH